MRTLIAALLALALSGGAASAQWNVQQTPMGNGWYSNQVTGPNGQNATGMTMPMGNGWSSTNWTDSRGHTSTCTTMPMGGGYSSTNCQ